MEYTLCRCRRYNRIILKSYLTIHFGAISQCEMICGFGQRERGHTVNRGGNVPTGKGQSERAGGEGRNT